MSGPATQPADLPNSRPATWSRTVAVIDSAVTRLDELFDRFYSSNFNPLHQSGTLAIVAFLVLITTGIFLFLFYSIEHPYQSVARIDTDIPLGSWVRALHTYAADLAMAAALLHALKMFLAGRFHGPRTRAWISGAVLVGATLACGWTGQVMAWDLQGQVVAVELTKIVDLLPLFSVPIGRAFAGLAPVPASFFFMNLFLHVCLPLGLAAALWLHLANLARPHLAPPRALAIGVVGVLSVLALVLRVPLGQRADLLVIPRNVPIDLLYNFWLPLAWQVSPAVHLASWLSAAALMCSVPWWWKNKRARAQPSWSDPEVCTGCTTCYKDCPFDAISMLERPDPGRRSQFYSWVNPARCVACGICAGSCAPMGIGPPAHTGRIQLRRTQDLIEKHGVRADGFTLLACRHNPLHDDPRLTSLPGASVMTVECAGNLHTSVIEMLLRAGSGGVFIAACPPRSAPCREGPKWLYERVYNDREAELPARVDKRRVAIHAASRGEWRSLEAEIESFRARLAALGPGLPAGDLQVGTQCEPKQVASRG
ncbi:MAG: hydrogenase iron-sulfur subunit [Deltaproteobacteria bacterium]|nr:hydrogenase iron-sulfur subunit [Deltaproteobacteria bacterium]